MSTITKPLPRHYQLPILRPLQAYLRARRQRRTTMDLIHSSPHLRRDIGLVEEHFHDRDQ